jgi:guanylate kinase
MLNKLIGNSKPGSLFVLSAPGGTGKTTLVKMLCDEFKQIKKNISYTTRPPRPHEKDGIDYHFVNEKIFEKKLKNNEFLEYAKVYETFYGTDYQEVKELLNNGFCVLLVLDIQGAKIVKEKMPSTTLIFISPPSLEELKERLLHRKKTTQEEIDWKVHLGKKEMEEIPLYDYLVVNDDLSIAYEKLKAILIADECRI